MMTVVAYTAGHIRVDVTLNVECKWERSGFAPHWERICLYIGRSSGIFLSVREKGCATIYRRVSETFIFSMRVMVMDA